MTIDVSRPSDTHVTVPSRALVPFFLLTFAITWGLVGPYIFFYDRMSAWFGEISGSHPFFFIATWAPAISAITIVSFFSGLAGLRRFLSRVRLWRVSVAWVAFVLVVPPLVYVAGSLIKGGPILAPMPPEGLSMAVAALFMMLFLGPVEEFGWRGVAQPLLQRHMAPFWAGMFIGAVWGVWHLPAFYLAGVVYADWNFLPFFVGNVTLAVLVTPLFNRSGGSILWPMLFHWQLIIPFWPDAQPWDTWIFVAVAALVAWANRATLFSRTGATTEVVPTS